MKTARSQFIKSVGQAVDIAAEEGVAPIEMISSLGSYVDIVVRCTGGDKSETSKMLSALSEKYSSENAIEQLTGEPIYTSCFAANG
ncbi:MAG: hypothetical protein IIA05_00065 [Proteobacteria bacterium]|nr:hypothetical protein [Pseudomonadota bacterium]